MKTRVCDGTADESYIMHASKSKVAYVLSKTPEKALVLFSKCRRSNSILRRHRNPVFTIDGKGPVPATPLPWAMQSRMFHFSLEDVQKSGCYGPAHQGARGSCLTTVSARIWQV